MATQYLFPCSCGRTITIEPRQAGDLLHCECGLSHRAPSMLEIRSLPSVHTAEEAKFHWKPAYGLVFAGSLLLLLSLALLALVALQMPSRGTLRITPEQVVKHAHAISPAQSVEFYRDFIVRGLDNSASNFMDKNYQDRLSEAKIGLFLVAILASISLALIGGGVWWVRSSSHR